MAEFYTYLWLREDGTPYYVGKGTGRRAVAPHRRVNRPPKDRILIQEFANESDAFAAEQFLISFYGRKDLKEGCLINLTNGGEGPSGAIMSEAWKEKQRKRSHNSPPPLTGEARERWIEKLRGKKMPTSFCEKNRLRMLTANPFKGRKHSEETRKKMREAAIARHANNPEQVSRAGYLGAISRWGAA